MRLLVIVTAACLLGSSVVGTAQEADTGTNKEPEFKLRRVSVDGPAKQVWNSREVIRNGGFDYGNGAWAISGGMAGVSTDAGRQGDGKDHGAYIHVANLLSTNGFMCQMLHLPEKTTAGTLRLDWRLVGIGDAPTLQALSFAIGSFNPQAVFESAAIIKEVNAGNFPGWGWQDLEHKLRENELKAINTMRGNKRQIVLIASISGESLQFEVDNVSLKLDGEFTPPKTPTFIAWAETSSVKGPDGGRQRYEINAAAANGSGRVNMFHCEDVAVDGYGLAWRPDGKELCFSSSHEMAFSYFSANLFALDDSGMRRVTNPPGRAELLRDKRKTGKVKLKVRNRMRENVQGAIYVEGARTLASFSLAPAQTGGEEQEVIIDDVVDFGEGILQYVIVRIGGKSAVTGATVDVLPGETADGGVAHVDTTLTHVNASSPCYSRDSKTITFNTGRFFKVDAEGGVPSGKDYGTLFGGDPALSPLDDSLVYSSYTGGLWVLKPGADQGTQLVSGDNAPFCKDACWFPDGSGVLFTSMTVNPAGWGGRNVCAVATQTKQTVQITDLFNENVEDPTLSPDGQWMAGVRTLGGAGNTHRELWVWKVSEPQTCWQIETKGQPAHPAWSPK